MALGGHNQDGNAGNGGDQAETPQEEKQRLLRQEIMKIQRDTSLTPQDKAKKIQKLMMRSWQQNEDGEDDADADDGKHHDANGQRRRKKQTLEDITQVTYFDEAAGVLGCAHYKRSCKIKAACCKRWYCCRICHDDDQDHQINRYATKKMVCMYCSTIQPVGPNCTSAKCDGRRLTHYYCDVCKFHDDDNTKNIYHCPDCKICRIGKGIGIDRYHCQKCNICLSLEYRDHKCIENSLGSNCPICNVYMFTSRDPVSFMRCGHAIHSACYNSYIRTNFTCPICHKSILSDLSSWIRRMDTLTTISTMPPEYRVAKATICCNDCEQRSTVPYHFIGHKCQNESCGSYNTNVLSTEGMPLFSATGELLSSPAGDVSNSTASSDAAATGEDGAPAAAGPQIPVDQLLHMLEENEMEFFSDEDDDADDDEDDDLLEEDDEEDDEDGGALDTTPSEQHEQ